MSIGTQICPDTLAWLLEPDEAGVRYLAMRDLLDLPAGHSDLQTALQAAYTGGPISEVLNAMNPEGWWQKPGPGYNPKYRSAVWSIILLAQLGASVSDDPRVANACAYMLEHSLTSQGQFTYNGVPSGTIDCLQGNLCWALQELGVQDERLEHAFDWMARSVTGDGIAPAEDKHAPLRYYAYNCGPRFACGVNNGQPCAWGGVKVMLAFGSLPRTRWTPQIYNAVMEGLDFLLGVDPATAAYPSPGTGKPNSSWWKLGFPVYYVTDILQLVEAVLKTDQAYDARLDNAIAWINNQQDAQGRWRLEYDYSGKTWGTYGQKKAPNKWVTLRALKVLKLAADRIMG